MRGAGEEAALRSEPVETAAVDPGAGASVGEIDTPHQVEQPDAVPTPPGGGLHDYGDPGLSEEFNTGQDAPGSSTAPSATAEAAPSSPAVILPAPAVVDAGERVRSPPRPASLPPATAAVEEVEREGTPPPQLVRTVIRRGNQFEVLEEDVADAETRRLRADLATMMARIEVSGGCLACFDCCPLAPHNLRYVVECGCRLRAASSPAGRNKQCRRGEQETPSFSCGPASSFASTATTQRRPASERGGTEERNGATGDEESLAARSGGAEPKPP